MAAYTSQNRCYTVSGAFLSACAKSPTSVESSWASSAAAYDTSFSYEIRPSRSNDLPTRDQLLKRRLADLSLPMGH